MLNLDGNKGFPRLVHARLAGINRVTSDAEVVVAVLEHLDVTLHVLDRENLNAVSVLIRDRLASVTASRSGKTLLHLASAAGTHAGIARCGPTHNGPV
jgi:hypothetical protein